jgi:hypothetical protein
MRTLPFLAAALLSCAGCASQRYTPIPSARPATRYAVTVDSRYTRDVTLYAVNGGIRTRIGVVVPGERHTFFVPQYLLDSNGQLHLVGRAAEIHEMLDLDPVLVHPGQSVLLTLESGLDRSSLGVW